MLVERRFRDAVSAFYLEPAPGIDPDALRGRIAGAVEGVQVRSMAQFNMQVGSIMSQLDLVIAPDSAVAHLAGGLGMPTFVALSTQSEWRWMAEREDSPWYPTMRLFRQKTLGDWDDVFRRMAEVLRQALA